MKDAAIVLVNTLDYVQKSRVSAQVRKSHLGKNKKTCDVTEQVLEKTKELEEWLDGMLESFVKKHPAYGWFSKVKGVGDLNIGKVVSLIRIKPDEDDPEKGWANNVSSLWRFCGFGCDEDGKAERMRRGEKLHYNKTLKAMCWRLAKSLIRAKGLYYDYYLEQKQRTVERLKAEGITIVPSDKLPMEKGKHVEKDGYFGLGHVDTMAMRKMIKLFLSHLWEEWRKAEGLEVTKPYVHAIKGHSDFIRAEEFIQP